MSKTRVPAVEGLFTMDDEPHLIGGKLSTRDTYIFPKDLGGGDPAAPGDTVEEVLLSRRGRIWSYTNSAYPPPAPLVVTTEPFVPVWMTIVRPISPAARRCSTTSATPLPCRLTAASTWMPPAISCGAAPSMTDSPIA